MPQMAPIWWTTLFIMFIMSFMMVILFMYFFNIYLMGKKNIKKMENIKMFNWMW